jgi:hypothetical protein
MSALTNTIDRGTKVDLWHWENSAHLSTNTVCTAIKSEGSKIWKLSLERNKNIDIRQIYHDVCLAYKDLLLKSPDLIDYSRHLKFMISQDLSLPDNDSERDIYFYVPYRRLKNGEFYTMWLIRSAANRLMHARGVLYELIKWISCHSDIAYAHELAEYFYKSYLEWKTLNLLGVRYDMGSSSTTIDMIVRQLNKSLRQDKILGLSIGKTS